ncbi:MAG TPA: Smr/MutS family protein [Stellaceae bacterium]|nr:Smr/MutS family protein [Stellaceae bacterium]
MPRRLSAEERALWREAMGETPPQKLLPADPAPAQQGPRRAESVLDRRNARRLRRGETAINARLDLHGLTQDEAHRALTRFVVDSHAAGRRSLLVITGKGTREGEGVLHRGAPRWLAEAQLRPLVLAVERAHPRHGGDGALYVLLRRKR